MVAVSAGSRGLLQVREEASAGASNGSYGPGGLVWIEEGGGRLRTRLQADALVRAIRLIASSSGP